MQMYHFNRSHMGLNETEQESFCSVLIRKNAAFSLRYLTAIVCIMLCFRSFFKHSESWGIFLKSNISLMSKKKWHISLLIKCDSLCTSLCALLLLCYFSIAFSSIYKNNSCNQTLPPVFVCVFIMYKACKASKNNWTITIRSVSGHHPQVDVCYYNVTIAPRALIILNRTTCYG